VPAGRRTAHGRGGGGEPVAARLVGGQLGGPEADELVQGVGDRARGPGQYLADLVWGEAAVRELAQVLLDQVAEPAGLGRRGAPAAGGGLQYPPPLGGLVPRGVQGGLQVPGCEGLPGLVGGLGDRQDVPGGLGGDGRVRVLRGAGFRFPACGGAVSGGWGGLADVGGAARAGASAAGTSSRGQPARRASRCRGCRAVRP
jgi:hypothetical protein